MRQCRLERKEEERTLFLIRDMATPLDSLYWRNREITAFSGKLSLNHGLSLIRTIDSAGEKVGPGGAWMGAGLAMAATAASL